MRYSYKYHHARVKYEAHMTTLTQKHPIQIRNSPTPTNRHSNDEDNLPSGETMITETPANKRFHTLCKRVFQADPGYFPSSEHHGKTIYFCTGTCLDAFLADPERFSCAHSQPASRK